MLHFYGNTVLKAIYASYCPLYKYKIILYYLRTDELFMPHYVHMPYYVPHFLLAFAIIYSKNGHILWGFCAAASALLQNGQIVRYQLNRLTLSRGLAKTKYSKVNMQYAFLSY